jgi:DNA polymerase V
MDGENFDGDMIYNAAYRGSKTYTQQNLRKANATGFTAAADDYMERGIDLNEQLIRNKPSTFFMRVKGNAMEGAGIFHGDIVIVDRSIKPVSGKIIIANLNGEMLIRRLDKSFNKIRLLPASANLAPLEVDISAADFSVWGVVTYNIHVPA